MTLNDKLNMLHAFLGADVTNEELSAYLEFSSREILNWKYGLVGIPVGKTDCDPVDEMVQIQSVIAGYNLQGIENQTEHNENGVNRKFAYTDMVEYIHGHINAIARVK